MRSIEVSECHLVLVCEQVDGLPLGGHHLRPAGDGVLEGLGRGAGLAHHVQHRHHLQYSDQLLGVGGYRLICIRYLYF